MAKVDDKAKRALVLIAVVILSGFAMGQAKGLIVTKDQTNHKLLVSIPDRKLAVLEDGQVLRIFSVSVGATNSPSPTGQFEIVSRLTNPTYYHPGTVIPPGQGNPIGPRWIGLNHKGYGIHGTNEPRSIGRAASHGCIRLRNRDIKQLFEMVRVGDSVEIRDEPDEQTAEIFGSTQEVIASAVEMPIVAGQ